MFQLFVNKRVDAEGNSTENADFSSLKQLNLIESRKTLVSIT